MVFVCVILVGICGETAEGCANPVFGQLVERGVLLSTGGRVRLPEPSMPDGLDRRSQEAVIRRVAARYSLKEFLRDSWTAPFVLKMHSIADSRGKRTGQRIDLWFVAHGSLETLTDEELSPEWQETAKPKRAKDLPNEARTLTDEELQARGLSRRSTEDRHEEFAYFCQPLFERVLVCGVVYSVLCRSEDSLLFASRLDPRFADDEKLCCRWQPIDRDRYGRVVLGSPRRYQGYGMYVKVTPLVDDDGKPSGALFIECHVAFDEPHDWFDGANLIRAKLPLAVREEVRDFRRQLKKLEAARRRSPSGNGR